MIDLQPIFDSNDTLCDLTDNPKISRKRLSVAFAPDIEQILFFDNTKPATELNTNNSLVLSDNDCQYGSISAYEQKKYQLMTNGHCKIYIGELYGIAHVLNLQMEKQVHCRYTVNEWKTWTEIPMQYIGSKSNHDMFQFKYPLQGACTFRYCFRIEMGGERWDNNNGLNYSCLIRKTCIDKDYLPGNHFLLTKLTNTTSSKPMFRNSSMDLFGFRDRHQYEHNFISLH